MRYSTLGNTGMNVSALGFGCMRLPMNGDTVDRNKSTPLLRRAYELGVNFFDTAIGYCKGDSQAAVGEAVEPFRDKVYLSTKNHHHTATPDEWRKHLENSLRFLRTDYVDVYNHHGINWKRFTENLDPEKDGLTKAMLAAKEEGLIRHAAFSFHGPADDLKKLADTGYYETVILQYNLLDQANAEAIHYLAEKGMGVVVMGPVGGGRLGIPSEAIKELTGGAAASTVEAALRFVWAHPGVNVALSGMQTVQMLEENVRIAENTEPFTEKQTAALNDLVEQRKKKSGLYCTGCNYCVPACPSGISIPQQLELLNQVRIFGLRDSAKQRYTSPWAVKVKATECIACGKCIEKCPQNIDIPARLREVITELDPRSGTIGATVSLQELTPDGSLQLRVDIHSLVDRATDLTVELTLSEGVDLETTRLTIDNVPAFGRMRKTVAGTLEQGTREIAIGLTLSYDGRAERSESPRRFTLLPAGLDDSWEGDAWFDVPAPAEVFSTAPETAGNHGMRFRLSHDDMGLLLLADVKDDFLFPSRPEEHKGKLVDGLELFLDGRPKNRVGKPRYEDNVYQIMLYPGTPGKAPAFYHAKDGIELDVSAEATGRGYRLRARVPFSSFVANGAKPRKIGFDLAANTANEKGERIAQYVFAGGPDNWQNASNFREMWLV